MAAPAQAPAPEEPKSGGSKGLIIALILVVVLLLVAVGVLAFLMLSHKDKGDDHAADAQHEQPYEPPSHEKAYSPAYKQFKPPAAGSPPQYFDLDQLVVNFKGEGKAKHLAVKVKMMTMFPEVVTELENIKPILINDFSAALRKKTYTEMSADDAQEKLAEELLKIARGVLESQKVYPDLLEKVLIERFVMQ